MKEATDRDWTGNANSIYATLAVSKHSQTPREKNDYYATDPHALSIFLDKIKEDRIELHHDIWEPACGEGHLSEVLKQAGYNVISTDLVDRGYGYGGYDFLKLNLKVKLDILTNPPYRYAKEFVEKAIDCQEEGYYTIMFLKIQFLEGQSRYDLFKKYPPKYVYVNTSRQKCSMNGEFEKYKATAVCYCWYIWQKGYKGETIIRWIR